MLGLNVRKKCCTDPEKCLKLEAKIYNETHLLLPMNGLSTTAYASAGVSSDGMTCAPSGPVPVPPKVEPDEPLRP